MGFGGIFHGKEIWIGREIEWILDYDYKFIFKIIRKENDCYIARLIKNYDFPYNLSMTYWLSINSPYPIKYKLNFENFSLIANLIHYQRGKEEIKWNLCHSHHYLNYNIYGEYLPWNEYPQTVVIVALISS